MLLKKWIQTRLHLDETHFFLAPFLTTVFSLHTTVVTCTASTIKWDNYNTALTIVLPSVILAGCLTNFSLPPNFMDYNSHLITRQVDTLLLKHLLCLCQREIIDNKGGEMCTCTASDDKFWVYDVLEVNTCPQWAITITLLVEGHHGGNPLYNLRCLDSGCVYFLCAYFLSCQIL